MKNKREWGRVLKFTLFSISAGAIEMASFALLNELLHGSYWPCYLIALTLSVLWNFTLNRKFTFQSANNVPQAMALVLLYYPDDTYRAVLEVTWNLREVIDCRDLFDGCDPRERIEIWEQRR